jgi:hypothetical protein
MRDDGESAVIWHVAFKPGASMQAHSHGKDYFEIILEGSQQVGRTWHGPGTVRVVHAGTGYGPLLAGPEGCRVLVIFPDGFSPSVPLQGDREPSLPTATNS